MPSSYRLGICGVTSSRQQCPSDEADVCSVSSIGTVRRQCHCELHWNINGSDLAQRWCAYVHGVCGALAVGISLGAWRLEAGARTRRIGARGCRARFVCRACALQSRRPARHRCRPPAPVCTGAGFAPQPQATSQVPSPSQRAYRARRRRCVQARVLHARCAACWAPCARLIMSTILGIH